MTMNFVGQAKTRLRASLHKCCRLTNLVHTRMNVQTV